MPVVVNLKTGHRVTVSDENGFEVSCTCGIGSLCQHIIAVVCHDTAALENPNQSGLLDETQDVFRRNNVDIATWLTKRLDDAKADPARAQEVPALEYAILNRPPQDDPNKAAHDAVRRLTSED